ncbi:MAG: gliding motility-associated C-terminal domain-containing protein, partial [Flavobacteriales bacterium]|nr:gliding motility-associated C-terminal domain-containing protein [Flavobacteriales bacterium]
TFSGAADGYVMRYSAAGNALLSSTYLGTPAYDQSYFVQLNTADEVFLVGQTHGNYPMTPGKYGTVNSAQFIHKLDHALGASIWSTRIGNGNVTGDISPTAFLVSDCGQIYVSGWAGSTNANAGNLNSTTVGLTVTPDAFQTTTNGSDVYLMVLEPEASALNYATYFGGGTSSEHVDGGTSRFDKNGTVYHAVCAGCGGSDDFPTTPGAWSNTNNSSNSNCNLGVFKFNLTQTQAIIGIDGPSAICPGDVAQFTNTSVGGTDHDWDFGDNSPHSTSAAPSHAFDTPGEYEVTMILTDSSGCVSADTASIFITVLPPPIASADPVTIMCPGDSVQLHASGGTAYLWSPSDGLTDPNIADPWAQPTQSTTYSVAVSDLCGSDTAEVIVDLFAPLAAAGPDTSVCINFSVGIEANGGTIYAWTPTTTLDDPASAQPIATPDTTTTYVVTMDTPEGCIVVDSVTVIVFNDPPQAVLNDTIICAGESVQLIADDAISYTWHVANGITTLDVQDPVVIPTTPTLYVVDLVNACGPLTDSAFVDLIFIVADAWPDTLICPGIPVQLGASGGTHYLWSPPAGLSTDTIADPLATPPNNTTYIVEVSDDNGCSATAQVVIELRPWPTVSAGPDVLIEYGSEVELVATGTGILSWSPTTWILDTVITAWVSHPEETITYTVTVTDPDGCTNTDALTIIVTGSLYLPNTFTPNGDGYNDLFGALGKDIKAIELLVFNRWGEMIWSTDKLDGRWDGTYHGVDSPIDTYVWKVDATEISGRKRNAVGHVNLVR